MAKKRFFQESELVFKEKPVTKRFQDLTGQKISMLTVIGYAGVDPKSYWYCKCDCGNITRINATSLKRRHTNSCGCFIKKITRDRSTTHGHTKNGKGSNTFTTWSQMISRCHNPNVANFSDYGGRGIKVCERWKKSFKNFLADMGERPEGKTLDRFPDNNGNYCKENCRWATKKEQANNRRSNRLLTYNGETKTLSQWTNEVGFKESTIAKRLSYNWPLEKALTTPLSVQHSHSKKFNNVK